MEDSIKRFNRAARKAIRDTGTFVFEQGGNVYHLENDWGRTYRCSKNNDDSVVAIGNSPYEAWCDIC